MMPLPHVSFDLQSERQPSPLTMLPSSHTSPFSGSVTPSPHFGSRQVSRHTASGLFEFMLPASQTSPFVVSTTPSPHFGSLQPMRHAALGAFEFAAPASHSSP